MDKESTKLLDRMRLVPKAEAEKWEIALTAASVRSSLIPHLTKKTATLVVIVEQDVLFRGAAFDPSESQVLRQRLMTIPHSAITTIITMADQNSALEQTDAALSVGSYDPLFKNDAFQPTVSQALVEAQDKAQAGSSEKQ